MTSKDNSSISDSEECQVLSLGKDQSLQSTVPSTPDDTTTPEQERSQPIDITATPEKKKEVDINLVLCSKPYEVNFPLDSRLTFRFVNS
jgi:hypothetical protein